MEGKCQIQAALELNKQLQRMKQVTVITEGHKDAKELSLLADELIHMAVYENLSKMYSIFRGRDGGLIFFTHDTFQISDTKAGNYVLLSDFIRNSGVKVCFSHTITDAGYFEPNEKTAYINITGDDLNTYLNQLAPKAVGTDGKFSNEVATRYFFLSLSKAVRHVLIHELQHAFDDYRSNSLYNTDKKSGQHYKAMRKVAASGGSEMTPEQEMKYWGLPHEYWARFAESVDVLRPGTWEQLHSTFMENFLGFHALNRDGKKRIIRALYKYCDEQELIQK